MKLFSAELLTAGEKESSKAVILLKKRSGYTLLNYYITEPENLKALSRNLPIYFCMDYYETVIETLEAPAVKDAKTFRLLARNKLRESLEEGVSYLMAYKQDEFDKPDKSGNISHKVYMVPTELFDSKAYLTEAQKVKINMFTLADFALCGMSKKLFGNETIFHAYADNTKVTVTVSKGDMIIYTRTMEYGPADGSVLENIFYENINLTYMFVSKNLRIDVDKMVLSGLLADKVELSKMLFDFNIKPQVSIRPGSMVENCSRELFHQFMIPLSLCMLHDAYDFTPERYQEKRGYGALKTIVNAVLTLVILLLLITSLTSYQDLSHNKESLNMQSGMISSKLNRHISSLTEADEQKYSLFYYSMLRQNEQDAFSMYGDVKDVLNLMDPDSATFELKDGAQTCRITEKRKFRSFKDIDAFRQRFSDMLVSMKSNKSISVKDSTKYNVDSLDATISLEIRKEEKRNRK